MYSGLYTNYSYLLTFPNLSAEVERASFALQQITLKNNEIISQLNAVMTEQEIEVSIFLNNMLKIGWPPALDFDIHRIKLINEAFNLDQSKPVVREIEKLLVKIYDKQKLQSKLGKWKQSLLLKNRIQILEAAIDAHLNSKYWLSVPAILPQIEGMIASGFRHIGYMGSDKLEKYVKSLLIDQYSPINTVNTNLVEFITKIVLANFKHGQSINSSLSRHAILHGADTNYGTVENSLKSILVFDYLQNSFRLVRLKDSSTYHLVGCPAIFKSNQQNELEFFKYSFEFSENQIRPCKKCKPPQTE